MDFNELFTTVGNLEKELNEYDNEVLVKLCSFLIKQYVMKDGIGYEDEIDDINSGTNQSKVIKEISTFVELVREMQRKYNFPELQKFSIEENKVYISAEGKRFPVTIDDKITGFKNEPVMTNKQFSKNKKENSESQSRFNNLEMDE
jgi:hypothetical protein